MMRIIHLFLISSLLFILGCHPVAHMPEPSLPYEGEVPLSQQVIIQTESKLIPKLEKDYARYQLRYKKTLSKSSGIYLFYANPGMSMDDFVKMLRRDVRVTQAQTNKTVSPR